MSPSSSLCYHHQKHHRHHHHHHHLFSHVETCTCRDNSIYMCELDYKVTSDTDNNPEKHKPSNKTLTLSIHRYHFVVRIFWHRLPLKHLYTLHSCYDIYFKHYEKKDFGFVNKVSSCCMLYPVQMTAGCDHVVRMSHATHATHTVDAGVQYLTWYKLVYV